MWPSLWNTNEEEMYVLTRSKLHAWYLLNEPSHFIHSTNIYWGTTKSPGTVPGTGDSLVSKTVKNPCPRASLVARWLRICLPMQGTRVRALVWEDPTCRGASGPVSHSYWACASGACAPQQEAATVRGLCTAMKSGPCLPQLEKALTQKRRPNTPKNKIK